MRSVKVEQGRLIDIMKQNRDQHRALFLKAQEGFRARVIEELDQMLEDARDGREVRILVGLEAQEDHTDDYDRVIGMLEMSVDAVVELDVASYEHYVRDRWSWSDRAMLKNTSYASGGKIEFGK